ncbi:MAG: hypothetical protein HC905_27580 [Bacteroidales bacterium]|nr:hypothetical protein [Bacteroidales bacterium]
MFDKVSIIGAGGHTRSLLNIIKELGLIIDGIYDDSYEPDRSEIINGYLLKGKINDVKKIIQLSFLLEIMN